MKTTLLSKIHTLQNCAEAYPLAQEQHTTIGDSVTVDGFKYYFTSQQKDLTNELCKEAQLNTTEACRIVLQQGRVGVVELDRLVKAYMEERTALLRIVKCLVRMDVHDITNVKTGSVAKELVSKIKEDKKFTEKLIHGIRKRVEQQLPPRVNADTGSALLWSRQVDIFSA